MPSSNEESKTSSASYEFRPAIEKFSYGLDEEIPIDIIFEADSPIKSLDSSANGFIEKQAPKLTQGRVTALIKASDNLNSLQYTVYANLANGSQLEANIYGIVEDGRLYVNGNSFFGARDVYMSEMLQSDKITERQYELYLKADSVDSFAETSYSVTTVPGDIDTKAASDTYVTGTLRWRDDWGNWHPLQYTKVTIMDEGGGWLFGWWDSDLGSVYTNANGVFSFGFSNRSGGRNIYIKVYPAGENSVVKTGANNEYVWRSSTSSGVATGSTTVKNFDITMASEMGRAFQVSQATIIAARYAKTMNGSNIANVTVRYPHNESSTGCFYSGNTVYIVGNRTNDNQMISGVLFRSYASWDVIQHEYNHHVQNKLGITANPGGWHTFGNNMYDHYMSHHGGASAGNCLNSSGAITCANPSAANAKDRAIKIAYAESWPSVVSGMAQQYAITYWRLDNNIQTVGDTGYNSYNGAAINYNTTAVRSGETVEASVAGVLWDLYDNDAESHDRLALGHTSFWNLSINSGAKTLSALINYFNANYSSYYYTSRLGDILSYYRMAATNINTSSALTTSPPTFNWTPNGTSNSLRNNSFIVIFYAENQSEILRVSTTSTSLTLTQDQWNSILYTYGQTFYVAVIATQTGSPSTGGYYSNFVAYTKPIQAPITESFTFTKTTRYIEKITSLSPGNYVDYYVTFYKAGHYDKLIQTFGPRDTTISIYDASGSRVAYNDDAGYGLNALIFFKPVDGVQYKIRVKFYSSSVAGDVKLVIFPAASMNGIEPTTYENLLPISMPNTLSGNMVYGTAIGYRITPPTTGTYMFETVSVGDPRLDMYLYIIDPRSTAPSYQDDDSGGNLQAKLSVEMEAGIPYLMIITRYNPTADWDGGWYHLHITQQS